MTTPPIRRVANFSGNLFDAAIAGTSDHRERQANARDNQYLRNESGD
jgi:hypothetical protein